MYKTLTTLGCIIVGAGLLGWYDRWHLAIGLPLLIVGMLISIWLRKRLWLRDEEALDERVDDAAEPGRQVLLGILRGGAVVLLLTGAFAIASWAGIFETLRGPDCSGLLREIEILAKGRAYPRIIEIVEEQFQPSMAEPCRRAFLEHKVRARLGLAEQLQGEKRLKKLRQAREEAERIPHPDLVRLIAAGEEAEVQTAANEKLQEAIKDRDEYIRRLKERDVAVQQTTRGEMVRLSDVFFDSGQATLTPAALEPLKAVAARLNLPQNKARRISVEGHTDATGEERRNQELSEKRAARVAEVLMREGVSRERLAVQGFGEKQPLEENANEAGRAKNRRVEIIMAPTDAS
jgi:outer membrane protein OmpA-like peptidoglycan-associated protein